MQDVFYDDHDDSGGPTGLRRIVGVALKWGSALLSLALVVAIVLWAYRLGVRDVSEIPVIRAQEGPARVQPQDPGGTEVAHQGLEVNEILAGNEARTPQAGSLAPVDAPLAAEDVPADPGALARRGQSASEISAAIENLLSSDPDLAEPEEITPGPLAALEPDADLDADTVSAEEPEDLGSSTALRPRSRPAALAGVRAEPSQQQAEPASRPGVSPIGVAPPPSAVGPSAILDPDDLPAGTRLVQVGAFDSQSQAEQQWARLIAAHGDLLGSKQRLIQRAESSGRTFFRLRVAQFGDRDAQQAICEALRARAVDCIPVTVR